MRSAALILAILTGMLSSCEDLFEYSPNQVFDRDTEVDLNAKNLVRLSAATPDDTTVIAFIGDSQRFYDELDRFIKKVNSLPSVDFVFLAGDISDFGLLEEFEQVQKRFSRLEKPFFGIVGNHDLLAKGEDTFEHMFGPTDFSFVYDSIKFIVHNTNGREYKSGNVPDMKWLRNEFNDEPEVKYFVPVSHIPPFSKDFDKSLEAPYTELFRNKKPLISLHGHIHEFREGYPYNDGILYMTSHSFDLRKFVLLKIIHGKVSFEIIDY